MSLRSLSFALLMALCQVPAAPADGSLADHVDPFIGTGGHGHTFPGASLPFGMVQLSPDTRLTGWDGCSGYHDDDRVIYGFSHTHLSGTGVSDYGDILLMPVTGKPHLRNGYPDSVDTGYGSRFSKETEHAGAGWYAVHLDDYGIDVELTATERTGVHRYVFPAGQPAHVIIDLEHRDQLLDADLAVADERTVTGFRRSAGWANDQWVFFKAAFSRPFTGTRVVEDTEGRPVKAVLDFGDEGGEVIAQVGISAVDADGAGGNLRAEWAEFDFDAARKEAAAAWQRQLAPFTVTGATDEEQTILATALYHSFLAPNLFGDADGRYRGLDQQIHTADRRDQYTVFSLWDTYRATHPLFTLVERDRTRDFVGTMLAQFEQSGRLPVWELAGNETNCMIGYHAVSVIADAYLKGIGGFDADTALTAMIYTADADVFGLGAYRRDGFLSSDQESESVSRTLEYAYDDFCIGQMARAMGRDDIAREFDVRSQSWRHLFDPQTRCFRPRRNGQWLKPFDPRRVDNNYTEANAWQYRFSAPQHITQLMDLYASPTDFAAALDSLFTAPTATTGRDQSDITGLIGQYAHGNEPSHHIAWLYHAAGQPEKTRQVVGRILDEFYTARPDGLIGNEDCGQMSSWYVLAAYGLYDIAPGDGIWCVIPPHFPEMTMRFEDGRTFTTRRVGEGAVASVTWNGKPLTRSYLTHAEVTGGGELVFHLGKAGNWGRSEADRPGSRDLHLENVVAAPWAEAEADVFRGRIQVALHAADPQADVYYEGIPTPFSPPPPYLATGPLTIVTDATLRFFAQTGTARSPQVTAEFHKLPHPDWRVTVASVPNPQYTAGGPEALIDGLHGDENWRTGGWQGYQGQDFTATVDFGTPLAVHEAGAEFLQDVRSWIVMPTELLVETSADGVHFTAAGTVTSDVEDTEEGSFTQELIMVLDGSPLRAIRFTGKNYGKLPAWHPGAGGEAFIFVDELIVE